MIGRAYFPLLHPGKTNRASAMPGDHIRAVAGGKMPWEKLPYANSAVGNLITIHSASKHNLFGLWSRQHVVATRGSTFVSSFFSFTISQLSRFPYPLVTPTTSRAGGERRLNHARWPNLLKKRICHLQIVFALIKRPHKIFQHLVHLR